MKRLLLALCGAGLLVCFPLLASATHVLLVDSDGSAYYPDSFTDVQPIFAAALTAGGHTFDVFEVMAAGADGPDAATMMGYPVVIWACGESWISYETLTPNDEINLAMYLDSGGGLCLSAHDYFYDAWPYAGYFYPGQFPYDYLGVTYTYQDYWMVFMPDIGHCVGLPGSVAEGTEFDMQDIYTTLRDGLYIDLIEHMGTSVFEVTVPGPTDVAACQFDGGGFRTVFTTVSLAALIDGADPSTLSALLSKIICWLQGYPSATEQTSWGSVKALYK